MKKILAVLLVCALLCPSAVLASNSQGSGASAHIYTFHELTGLSENDINRIVITRLSDRASYSTGLKKLISDIYSAINTQSFGVNIPREDDQPTYSIMFLAENGQEAIYVLSQGIKIKRLDGLTYKSSQEERLVATVEQAFSLIANDSSPWASDYIVRAKELGLMDGLTSLSYSDPVTREAFGVLIYNLVDNHSDITWSKASPKVFRDTENEKLLSLCLAGIVTGYGNYSYAPDKTLTREEAAVILMRAYTKFCPASTPSVQCEYQDADLISDWAKESVAGAYDLGIMTGGGNGVFAPKSECTFEEAIAAIVKLYRSTAQSDF